MASRSERFVRSQNARTGGLRSRGRTGERWLILRKRWFESRIDIWRTIIYPPWSHPQWSCACPQSTGFIRALASWNLPQNLHANIRRSGCRDWVRKQSRLYNDYFMSCSAALRPHLRGDERRLDRCFALQVIHLVHTLRGFWRISVYVRCARPPGGAPAWPGQRPSRSGQVYSRIERLDWAARSEWALPCKPHRAAPMAVFDVTMRPCVRRIAGLR
jgi:hypothetical protein